MADVPANAMEAATSADAMGTEFETVAMGDGACDFAGTSAEGMGYQIEVMGDDPIEEIGKQIDAAPEAERAGFVPEHIEGSSRTDASVVREFEGTHDRQAADPRSRQSALGSR